MNESLLSTDDAEPSSRKTSSDQIRSLFLLRGVPYPAVGGAGLRNQQNIEALRKRGPVRLISIVPRVTNTFDCADSPPALEFATKAPPDMVGHLVKPFGARVCRWWKLYRRRRRHDLIMQTVSREIAAFDPDLIVFEQPYCVRYVPNIAQLSAKLIYDAHNVEAKLAEAMAGIKKDGAVRKSDRTERSKEAERLLMEAVDQAWVCSDDDGVLLREVYDSDVDSHLVPNGIDVDRYTDVLVHRSKGLSVRNGGAVPTLLFAGDFAYHPNVAGARFLVDSVLPKLRKTVPEIHLVLCGRKPPVELLRYAEMDSGISVTGQVPDTRPYFEQCDVVVVPLLHGGGTRLKILEAFAAGCPVVSTTKGAEGLAVVDGEHLLIADTPEAMAYQIGRCLADQDLVSRLASAGRALVVENYSWPVIRQRIDSAVSSLLDKPARQHRGQWIDTERPSC